MLARMTESLHPNLTPVKDQDIDKLKEVFSALGFGQGSRCGTKPVQGPDPGPSEAPVRSASEADHGPDHRDRRRMPPHAAACREQIAATPQIKARLDKFASIPGLGESSAIVPMIDMPETGYMDAKHVARLADRALVTKQSGQWRGKAFIQG